MVAAMKKKDFCCLYAALAAIGAIFLVSVFSGYSFSDWGKTTWIGVLVVIVAVVVCMKCRREDEEDQG